MREPGVTGSRCGFLEDAEHLEGAAFSEGAKTPHPDQAPRHRAVVLRPYSPTEPIGFTHGRLRAAPRFFDALRTWWRAALSSASTAQAEALRPFSRPASTTRPQTLCGIAIETAPLADAARSDPSPFSRRAPPQSGHRNVPPSGSRNSPQPPQTSHTTTSHFPTLWASRMTFVSTNAEPRCRAITGHMSIEHSIPCASKSCSRSSMDESRRAATRRTET